MIQGIEPSQKKAGPATVEESTNKDADKDNAAVRGQEQEGKTKAGQPKDDARYLETVPNEEKGQEVVPLNQQKMVDLEEEDCLDEEHLPKKWNDFVILDDNKYFKEGEFYGDVPCHNCGRLAHRKKKSKSNETHFQLDDVWQVRRCPNMGRNRCTFYICGHCFVAEQRKPTV